MKVAVIPTGRTEWQGLAPALGRLFPGHDFYCLPTQAEVSSSPNQYPYAGITSHRLSEQSEREPPEAAADLVARAIQEAIGDRRRTAADLVIIIDDLELYNADQPERVVAVVRRAAQVHLESLGTTGIEARVRAALREKISFHLVAPTIEAWFFADQQALRNAGVTPDTNVVFDAATDPERFETNDPQYLAATEQDCTVLATLTSAKKKKLRPKWLGALSRGRHPKGYLQWLTRDPNAKGCTRYSETKSGGPALAALDWSAVFSDRPHGHLGYLRALIEDLEDGLGAEAKGGPFTPTAAKLTSRHTLPEAPILRNL